MNPALFNSKLTDAINTANTSLFNNFLGKKLQSNKRKGQKIPNGLVRRLHKVFDKKLIQYQDNFDIMKTGILLVSWSRAINNTAISAGEIGSIYIKLIQNYYNNDVSSLMRVRNGELEFSPGNMPLHYDVVELELEFAVLTMELYKLIIAFREIESEKGLKFSQRREMNFIEMSSSWIRDLHREMRDISYFEGVDQLALIILIYKLYQYAESRDISIWIEFKGYIESLNTPLTSFFNKLVEKRIIQHWFDEKFGELKERQETIQKELEKGYLDCPYYSFEQKGILELLYDLQNFAKDQDSFELNCVQIEDIEKKLNKETYIGENGDALTSQNILDQRYNDILYDENISKNNRSKALKILLDLRKDRICGDEFKKSFNANYNELIEPVKGLSFWEWCGNTLFSIPEEICIYATHMVNCVISGKPLNLNLIELINNYEEPSRLLNLSEQVVEERYAYSNPLDLNKRNVIEDQNQDTYYLEDSLPTEVQGSKNNSIEYTAKALEEDDLEDSKLLVTGMQEILDKTRIQSGYNMYNLYQISDRYAIRSEYELAPRVLSWFDPNFNPKLIEGYSNLNPEYLQKQILYHNFALKMDKIIFEYGFETEYYNEKYDRYDKHFYLPIKVHYEGGQSEELRIAEITLGANNNMIYHRYLAQTSNYEDSDLGLDKFGEDIESIDYECKKYEGSLERGRGPGDRSYIAKDLSTPFKLVVIDPKNSCHFEVMLYKNFGF